VALGPTAHCVQFNNDCVVVLESIGNTVSNKALQLSFALVGKLHCCGSLAESQKSAEDEFYTKQGDPPNVRHRVLPCNDPQARRDPRAPQEANLRIVTLKYVTWHHDMSGSRGN